MKPSRAAVYSLLVACLWSGCGTETPGLPEGHPVRESLMLLQEGEPRERETAARTLGQLAADDPHEVVTQALLTATYDHQSRVQIAAVRALGQQGDSLALERLIVLTRPGQASGLRQAACEALGAIGDPVAVSALSEASGSDELTVSLAATLALAKCGEEGRQSLLALYGKAHENEKAGLITALAQMESDQDLALFQEALHASNPSVTQAAAKAISERSAEVAIPILLEALSEGTLNGEQAVTLFVSMDSPLAHTALCRLLSVPSSRKAAAGHLKRLHAKILPDLHTYFADEKEDGQGRLVAMDLILDITEQVNRKPGFGDVKTIKNPQYIRNKFDLLTIDLHQHPELVDLLKPRLEDTDPAVRLQVATLLGWQGFREGLPVLLDRAGTDVSAQNIGVWKAIARFRGEARKRNLEILDQLAPLSAKAGTILNLRHDSGLIKSANTKGDPNREQAQRRLGGLIELQVAVLPVAAALQEPTVRDPVLSFVLQEQWPKNPRGYHRLGSVATEVVGAWKDPEMEAMLLTAYREQPTPNRLRALGRLQVKEAVPEFIAAVESFSDRGKTVEAIRALGESGDPRACEVICDALRRTPPPRMLQRRQLNEIAQVGIPALQKLGDPKGIETLVFLVRQPTDPNFPLGYGAATRGWAVNALMAFPDPAGPEALVKLMQDPTIDLSVKDRAIVPALIRSENQAVVSALVEVMRQSPAPENGTAFDAGYYAADVLGLMGDASLPALVKLSGEPGQSTLMLQRCARAYSHSSSPEAIEELRTLLAHESREVTIQAALALGRNLQPGSLEALQSLNPDHPDVQKAIHWAISQHKK